MKSRQGLTSKVTGGALQGRDREPRAGPRRAFGRELPGQDPPELGATFALDLVRAEGGLQISGLPSALSVATLWPVTKGE